MVKLRPVNFPYWSNNGRSKFAWPNYFLGKLRLVKYCMAKIRMTKLHRPSSNIRNLSLRLRQSLAINKSNCTCKKDRNKLMFEI